MINPYCLQNKMGKSQEAVMNQVAREAGTTYLKINKINYDFYTILYYWNNELLSVAWWVKHEMNKPCVQKNSMNTPSCYHPAYEGSLSQTYIFLFALCSNIPFFVLAAKFKGVYLGTIIK